MVALASTGWAQDPEGLYYQFNENGGQDANNTAVPGVGNAVSTFTNTVTWNTGNIGASYVVLPGNSEINTGWATSLSGTSWTLEFWLRVNTGGNLNYITGDSSVNSFRVFTGGVAGNGVALRGLFGTDCNIVGTCNDNNWHHVAWVYDMATSEVRTFRDGVLDSTYAGQTPNATVGTGFRIGTDNSTRWFTGDLDEFRLWFQARSDAEILANFNAEVGIGDPEINVERPANTTINSNGTDNIGPRVAGLQAVLTYTVRNLGAANNLNVSNITLTGANNCTANPSATSFAVTPGNTQTFDVNITPTAAGPFDVLLTITNDDLSEGSYTITIQGTGANDPEITVERPANTEIPSGGSDSAGIVAPNTPQMLTYTVRNSGVANNLNVSAINATNLVNCGVQFSAANLNVAPGATATFDATVTPTAGGAFSFDMELTTNDPDEGTYTITVDGLSLVSFSQSPNTPITDNAGFAHSINVSGLDDSLVGLRVTVNATHTWVSDLEIYLIPPSVAPWAGAYAPGVGASNPQAVTLMFSNGGSGDNLVNTRFTGSADQAFTAGGPIAGGVAPFTGTYTPIDDAEFNALYAADPNGVWTIVVIDHAGGDQGVFQDWTLEFIPPSPGARVKYRNARVDDGSSVDIGNIGEAVPMNFNFAVSNTASTALSFTGNPDAVVLSNFTNCTATVTTQPTGPLAQNASTTFTVQITGTTAANPFSLDVSFDNTDPARNPFNFTLTGQVVTPVQEIEVQRPQYTTVTNGGTDDVGLIAHNQAANFTYTIENRGSLALAVTNVAVTPGAGTPTVAVTQQPQTPVTIQGTTTFIISVTPTQLGAFDFNVSITNDDPANNPYTFTVNGSGAMIGTYTINNDPAANPDFADFGAAFNSLETNGIAGAVTFDVSDDMGPYTASLQYELNAIPGQGAANPVVFRPAAGERPVIQGGMISIGGIIANAGLVLNGCQFVTIEGVEFDGNGTAGHGAVIFSDSNPTTDCTIRYCGFHNMLNSGAAIIGEGGSVANAVFANNVLFDCQGASIGVGPDVRGVLFLDDATGARVVHNTIVNTQFAVPSVVHQAMAGTEAAAFSNNIVYAGAGTAAYDHNGTHPATANGNVWYLESGVNFGTTGLNFGAWQTGGRDASGQLADPLFRDMDDNDFHLAANSPAIDAAVALTPAVTQDIEGDTRPIGAANDVGADEYNPNGPVEIKVTYRNSNVADGGSVNLGNLGDAVAMNFSFDIANIGGSTLALNGNPIVVISNELNCSVSIATTPSATVGAGTSTTLTLTVTGSGAGNTASFDVSIDNNDANENPFTFSVSGSVVTPAPEISVQHPAGTALVHPAALNVGTLPVNGTFSYDFVIENIGSAQLNLTGTPAVSPNASAGLTVSITQPGTVALPLQTSTTFSVEIQPTVAGAFNVTLTIDSNDPNVPSFTVDIAGTAANQPYLVVNSTLAFGSLVAGQNTTKNLVLENVGTQTLTVTSLSLFNPNFVVSNAPSLPFTIAAGGNVSLTFRFQPSATGNFSANLTIVSDSGGVAGTTHTVNFTGTATTGSGTVTKKKGCGVMPDGGQNPLWFALLAFALFMLAVRRRMS